MRPALVLVVVALSVSACGGGKKDVAKSARPCLERIAEYLHHVPRVQTPSQQHPVLPVNDPDYKPQPGGQITQLLPVPEDFQEYGELLFPTNGKGANSVQILIFGDEELPKRIEAQSKETPTVGGNLVPGRKTVRIGQTLLLWSSTPTASQ